MVLKTVFTFLLLVKQMESKYGTELKREGVGVRHCSPPTGSVDGSILVEDGGGGIAGITTLTWQVALGSTLCYR